MSDFTAVMDWYFSAMLTMWNTLAGTFPLNLFLALGILVLVWKIYDLIAT